jgi:hypothetical protein
VAAMTALSQRKRAEGYRKKKKKKKKKPFFSSLYEPWKTIQTLIRQQKIQRKE